MHVNHQDVFQYYNRITHQIIGSVLQVHSALGPGLLETSYEVCLEYELVQNGLQVARQVPQPLVYKGVKLDAGYRIDLLVEDCIILEIKSVAAIAPVHKAQLLTYLKLTGLRVGLLLNFNVDLMKNGITRLVR